MNLTLTQRLALRYAAEAASTLRTRAQAAEVQFRTLLVEVGLDPDKTYQLTEDGVVELEPSAHSLNGTGG